MARRGGGPTITLFSFQDIITSVSGIMIFVTLLLALELAQKSAAGGGDAAERDAGDLRSRIVAARVELEELRHRALADPRSQARSTLFEARAAREAADQVDAAEREMAELERRTAAARRREEEAKAREAGAEDRLEALRQQRAEVDLLRKKLSEARNGDRVYFMVDVASGARRDGWLALVDGKALAVAPLGRVQRPRIFEGAATGTPDHPSPATHDFLNWAAHEARGAYILLVARPSGIGRVEAIQRIFSSDRHPYGLDLVTETQEVLDPENGVYRP
jgi:hypothetical protein